MQGIKFYPGQKQNFNTILERFIEQGQKLLIDALKIPRPQGGAQLGNHFPIFFLHQIGVTMT